MRALAATVSEPEITTYLPDAFTAVGSVPQSAISRLMHGTRGLVFGSVSALVTSTGGEFVLPRRSPEKKFFSGTLDYSVSGTMLSFPERPIRSRHETPEEALVREAGEEGGNAFALYLQKMMVRAPAVVFAPDPENGMPFWEYLVLLLGVPDAHLPVFNQREHDSRNTEYVRFNDALEHVVRDQSARPGKFGLVRALQWATKDRVEKLRARIVTE